MHKYSVRVNAETNAPPLIRTARLADLEALLALEQTSFSSDRISRRQYRHHLHSTAAIVMVAKQSDLLVGSALVLFRRGTRIARLYSLAIAGQARGRGIGRALLDAVAAKARARSCTRLRLEVRPDNAAAIGLYARAGLVRIGQRPDFYEDGSEAWIYELSLAGG
jgi:ribosomal-protein-alanine N-acetyltransferase